MHVQNRLAEIRLRRGISAAALAIQVGVKRQTIYAIESGTYVPNTVVALRLAQTLEVTVEELFSIEKYPPTPLRTEQVDLLVTDQGGPLRPSRPVRLCRVGKRLIGVASPPVVAELPAADGIFISAGRSQRGVVQPFYTEEDYGKRLLIAGCDPAMSVLARHLARYGDAELVIAGCSSLQALRWLKARRIHIAGTHLRDEATGGYNVPVVNKFFPKGGYRAVTFAVWEEGLLVARGNPKRIRDIGDLWRKGLRLINREVGSGSRFLLDGLLQKQGIPPQSLSGYEQTAPGHIPAAWNVYSGQADCCIATQAAARLFSLDFVPLVSDRYDLIIPESYLPHHTVQVMLDVMNRSSLKRELESLGGYDTSQTGRMWN